MKHGVANFDVLTLSTCDSRELADCIEREQIAEHRSTEAEFGYNICAGGWGNSRTFCKNGHDLTVPGARTSARDTSCRVCKLAKAKERLARIGSEERNKASRKHSDKLKRLCAENPDFAAARKATVRAYKKTEYEKLKLDPVKWKKEQARCREKARRTRSEGYKACRALQIPNPQSIAS